MPRFWGNFYKKYLSNAVSYVDFVSIKTNPRALCGLVGVGVMLRIAAIFRDSTAELLSPAKVRSQLTTGADGGGIMKAQVRDKASDAAAPAMKNLSENVVLMLTQGGLMSYNMKYEFGEFC